MYNRFFIHSVRPDGVSPEEPFSDDRIDQGLEWLLQLVTDKFDDLDARVKKDLYQKDEEERKKRLERERRVLKNKIASAFIGLIDPALLPEGVTGIILFSIALAYAIYILTSVSSRF